MSAASGRHQDLVRLPSSLLSYWTETHDLGVIRCRRCSPSSTSGD